MTKRSIREKNLCNRKVRSVTDQSYFATLIVVLSNVSRVSVSLPFSFGVLFDFIVGMCLVICDDSIQCVILCF